MHRKVSTRFGHTEKEKHGFVSTKFESQDFDYYENEIIEEEESRRGKRFIALVIFQRFILFLAIGVFVGFCGSLVDLGVHYGSQLRYTFLAKYFEKYFRKNDALLFAMWMATVIIPALIGSVIVIYIEPYAAGGGVNWVLAYLNGVDLSKVNTVQNIVVKIISNILCCVAGLPGGKEAPLIHVGAITGSLIPTLGWRNFRPFRYFLTQDERRDMAAAGTAAGLTSAFACPIGIELHLKSNALKCLSQQIPIALRKLLCLRSFCGTDFCFYFTIEIAETAGIMIAFEESLSFWNAELTFLIFLCALSAYVTVLFIIDSIYFGCTDCFATQFHLFLETVNKSDPSFYVLEIFMFMFLGSIGGLLGATWNALQKKLMEFRKRFVNKNWKRVIEIIIIAVLNSVIQLILIFSLCSYCVKKPESSSKHDSHYRMKIPQLDCKNEDEEPVIGILVFQSQLKELQSIFTEGESLLGIVPLICFAIFTYFATCLLCGSYITHGVFVPHILIGAVWGRLIAETIQYIFPSSKSWARPNKFAFLCGAAQLSGSIHLTFTISIMMLEICNVASLSIPVFIVVSFAKLFGNLINESIYHSQVCASGLPVLNKEVPPLISRINATDIMGKTETIVVPLIASHELLRNVLLNTTHNGFPVVDAVRVVKDGNLMTYGTLKGFIHRYQIIVILNNNLTDEDLKDEKVVKKIYNQLRLAAAKQPKLLENTESKSTISLKPIMNKTPYFIHYYATASQVHRLFAGLGLRHLVVVTDSHQVVGVITRRNLSIFRHHETGLTPRSHILPLK